MWNQVFRGFKSARWRQKSYFCLKSEMHDERKQLKQAHYTVACNPFLASKIYFERSYIPAARELALFADPDSRNARMSVLWSGVHHESSLTGAHTVHMGQMKRSLTCLSSQEVLLKWCLNAHMGAIEFYGHTLCVFSCLSLRLVLCHDVLSTCVSVCFCWRALCLCVSAMVHCHHEPAGDLAHWTHGSAAARLPAKDPHQDYKGRPGKHLSDS